MISCPPGAGNPTEERHPRGKGKKRWAQEPQKSGRRSFDLLWENATGLLLHPSVGESLNEAVVIQNHEIRFATVDLGAPAREIREQLLQILEDNQDLESHV